MNADMGLVGGIIVYLVVWWMVFFAVLPWGVVSQIEQDAVEPGTEPGAPIDPGLGRKALITTVIAAGLWLIIYVVIANGFITLGTSPTG